jgi:hypothetical protein
VSAPLVYKDAAEHFDIGFCSADKVRPSNRLEAKDLRAMPAACDIHTSTHRKTTGISHHLTPDGLEGCRNCLFGSPIPFTGYKLEASTKDYSGTLTAESIFGTSKRRNIKASQDGMMSIIQVPGATDLESIIRA